MVSYDTYMQLLGNSRRALLEAKTAREAQAAVTAAVTQGIWAIDLFESGKNCLDHLDDEELLRLFLRWLTQFNDAPIGMIGKSRKTRAVLRRCLPVLLELLACAPARSTATIANLFLEIAKGDRNFEHTLWNEMVNTPGFNALKACIDYLALRPHDKEWRPIRMRELARRSRDVSLTAYGAFWWDRDLSAMASARRRTDPFRHELEGLSHTIRHHFGDDPGFDFFGPGGEPPDPPWNQDALERAAKLVWARWVIHGGSTDDGGSAC